MRRSTIDPIAYRQRASRPGKCADPVPDTETACRLLHEAPPWIQLARNEEHPAIRGHHTAAAPFRVRLHAPDAR